MCCFIALVCINLNLNSMKAVLFITILLFSCIGTWSQNQKSEFDILSFKPFNSSDLSHSPNDNIGFELSQTKSIISPLENYFKSISGNKQFLDSIILESWDDVSVKKYLSTNNEFSDNVNSSVVYTRFKDVYAYDLNENVKEIIRSYYDEITRRTFNQYKHQFEYDVNRNIMIYITSNWNETISHWDAYTKEENTYDDKGNITTNNLSYWNQSADKWGPTISKKEYLYDSNENLISYIEYQWNGDSIGFSVKTKNEYTYDANGDMITDIFSYWDDFSNKVVTYSKTVFIYNVKGKEIQFKWFTFNQSTSNWDINNRAELTYDSNGNMILEEDFDYKLNIKGDPIYKKAYSFDDFGRITKYTDYIWNPTTSNFIVDFIAESKFDVNGYKIWDSMQGPDIVTSKNTYYYSDKIPTTIPSLKENMINVYPNPAIEYILFDLANISEDATIEFIDIQGKKVLDQKFSSNKQVSVNSLPKGEYLYKLNNRGDVYSGKVIVR